MTKEELGQKTKLKYPQYNNLSDTEVADMLIAKYPVYANQITQPTEQKSWLQETGEDVAQTFGALRSTAKQTTKNVLAPVRAMEAGKQGVARTFAQSFGAAAGGISRGIGDVVTGGIKAALPQAAETAIKSGVQSAISSIAPIAVEIDKAIGAPVGSFMAKYQNLDEKTKRDVDALLGVSSLAFDIATAGIGKKAGQEVAEQGARFGARTAQKTKQAAGTIAEEAARAGSKIATDVGPAISQAISPKPKPIKALGEVLQTGIPADVKKSIKGLASLDVSDVKTYNELNKKISSKISELAQQVDADLIKDTTKTKLDDLIVTAKTTGGETIASNPVKTALSQLEELYNKIGDPLEEANIKELAQRATEDGLTKQDVNLLARKYGVEFGSKAFNKMGDPLTSVNAQLYENTRKSLKEIARSGISGQAAKEADSVMTSLYNVQRLVEKNIIAVNKLTNKIAERGLLERFGHLVSKYGDILTGGTVRGFVGGLLPRGAGYKVMNALDIEKNLARNLKIINEAITSKSDEALNAILKKLKID